MPFDAVEFVGLEADIPKALASLNSLDRVGYRFAGVIQAHIVHDGDVEIDVYPHILLYAPATNNIIEYIDETNRLRVQCTRLRERAEKAEAELTGERLLHDSTHEELEEARARLAVAANQS